MVLTVSFELSPVTGLFCHRRLRIRFANLNASVGASGPYDFAVRLRAIRQRRISVHRIPPRVRDDRDTPFCGTGRRRFKFDLGQKRTEIFLKMGLDGERKSVSSRGAHSEDRHLLIDALEKHLFLRDHKGSQQLFDPWRIADIFA